MSEERSGRFLTQIASGRLSSEWTTGFDPLTLPDDESDEVVLGGLSIEFGMGTLASEAWRFLR